MSMMMAFPKSAAFFGGAQFVIYNKRFAYVTTAEGKEVRLRISELPPVDKWSAFNLADAAAKDIKYRSALADAVEMMEGSELEPTSALKQAGSDHGIPYGDDMGAFVTWARRQLFGNKEKQA